MTWWHAKEPLGFKHVKIIFSIILPSAPASSTIQVSPSAIFFNMHFWTFPCALHASPKFVDLLNLTILSEYQIQTKMQFVILIIFCSFQVLPVCYTPNISPSIIFKCPLNVQPTAFSQRLGTVRKDSSSCCVFRIIQETDTAILFILYLFTNCNWVVTRWQFNSTELPADVNV